MERGGVLLPVGVGLLLGGERSGEGEGKGGAAPPLLVQFGPGGRRRAAHPGFPSLSPLRPIWPITSPEGVPVTLRHSGFIRNFSRTLPVFEYSRPIYRSLRLDHFETPRHIPDLIRDSELLRYIKTQ